MDYKNSRGFKIRTKLIFAFLIIICLVSVSSIISFNQIQKVADQSATEMPYTELLEHISECDSNLNILQNNVDIYLEINEESSKEKAFAVMAVMKQDLPSIVAIKESTTFLELNVFEQIHVDLENNLIKVLSPAVGSKPSNIDLVRLYRTIDLLHQTHDATTAKIIDKMRQNAEDIGTISYVLKSQFLLLACLVLIIGFSVAVVLSYNIMHSLKVLRDVSVKVTKGDLTARAVIKSHDEIGELANYFNQMIESLNASKSTISQQNKDLEKKVFQRTKELHGTTQKLQEKMEQLESFNSLVTGRELKMVELKKKIVELEARVKTSEKQKAGRKKL